jgi:hypothetical protein
MISILDKLNLRPQERRLVMVAVVVLFVVINFWLVFPHFSDWKSMHTRLDTAKSTAVRFEAEVAKTADYKAKLETLWSDGSFVVPDEQSLALVQTIQTEAATANVAIQRLTPAGGGPIPNNPFFEEQRVTVNIIAGEGELVEFLKKLGSGNSLIRVRDLELKPDAGVYKLVASLTIVGNYQKKPPAKPATPVKSGGTNKTENPKKS